MKPKNILLIILFCLGSFLLNAQAFEYTYDAAGNRIARQEIVLKSASIDNSSTETKGIQQDAATKTVYNAVLGEMTISIYPNPTKGNLLVKIENATNLEEIEFKLIDMKGTIILMQENITESNSIDLYDQPQGTYILNIYSGKEFSSWKIIKE